MIGFCYKKLTFLINNSYLFFNVFMFTRLPPWSYILLFSYHRCSLVAVVAEVDRILRPEGKLIVRDDVDTMHELEGILRSLQWKVQQTYSEGNAGLLCAKKTMWRPIEAETIMSNIA